MAGEIQLRGKAFRSIGEVAELLDLPQHVLRFWEARFHEFRPLRRARGRRAYRIEDIETLLGIRHLLHVEGLAIRGVQKRFRERGVAHIRAVWRSA